MTERRTIEVDVNTTVDVTLTDEQVRALVNEVYPDLEDLSQRLALAIELGHEEQANELLHDMLRDLTGWSIARHLSLGPSRL